MTRDPVDSTGSNAAIPASEISFRQTFRALRHRNFRLFFYGQLVSLTGTWMQQTAMSWLVYQITGSKILLGVVAAAGSAPLMIFATWGGSLADRHPKRSILVVTQIAQMLLAFVFAAAVWGGMATPWFIVVIAVLNGTAMGFDMPARQSFTVEMASREDLLNAISLNSSIFNGARVIGPALAGLLMGSLGVAMCFFLNGVSFLAVIAGLLMMRLPAHVTPAGATSSRAHLLGGFSYVAKHPRMRTIFLLFGAVGIFGWSYAVLMPVFARDILHLGAHGYGGLMSASGIGSLAGALAVASAGQIFPPRRIALGGVWLFSTMLLAFALNRNFYLALLILALGGFGMMLFFSTSNTIIQSIVPNEMRGRVMGVWALVFGTIVPLGSLEAGALAHWFGAPATIAFGAVTCAISGVVTLMAVRRREAKMESV